MSIHMKKGDIAAVQSILDWVTTRNIGSHKQANDAFIRIKREIRELRFRLKEETAATNRYIERLHALERKNENES